jgi:hypothetical protein
MLRAAKACDVHSHLFARGAPCAAKGVPAEEKENSKSLTRMGPWGLPLYACGAKMTLAT